MAVNDQGSETFNDSFGSTFEHALGMCSFWLDQVSGKPIKLLTYT